MASRAIIINASAGADDKQAIAEKLAPIFAAGGIDAQITLARSSEELIEAARGAAAGRPLAVVAGGGDGTLSTVASTLAGTDVPFGVLPLGTLNHFAKDLGIPLDPEEAARNIVAGHVVSVDVGEVNGRIFLNNSSLGIYPRIVRQREHQQRQGRGKWTAFTWATLRALRRYIFLSVALRTKTEQLSLRTPFVFIGNNEYQMESLNMGGRTCLNAGQLSVVVAHRAGRWGLLRLAVRALVGRLRESREFDAFCTTEIRIETRRDTIDVALDGEVTRMETPLNYRVRPGALRVIVPAGGKSPAP
jgi:diacylglycerol kinase family enzyme